MRRAHPFQGLRPMKAPTQSCDPLALRYPVLASPKIDGFRGFAVGGEVLTSSLDRFRNDFLHATMAHPRVHGLDGELVAGEPCGSDVHARTSSALTSRAGEPDFTWWLFDDFSQDAPFWQRMQGLHNRAQALPARIRSRIQVVPQVPCDGPVALMACEERWVEQGYEGAMVRDPAGPYKYGRCTVGEGWIFKLKRFEDAEFVITAVEPAMANGNSARRLANGAIRRATSRAGRAAKEEVGVLVGTDVLTGRPLRVSPGTMTGDERRHYWQHQDELIYRVATYKSFREGRTGAPSFPTFKCLRPEGT